MSDLATSLLLVVLLYAYWHLLSHGPMLVRVDPSKGPITPTDLDKGTLPQAPIPGVFSWRAAGWTAATTVAVLVAQILVGSTYFDSPAPTAVEYVLTGFLTYALLRLTISSADSKEQLVQEPLGWTSNEYWHARIRDARAGIVTQGVARLFFAGVAGILTWMVPEAWHNAWADWISGFRPFPLSSHEGSAVPLGVVIVWLFVFQLRAGRYWVTIRSRREDAYRLALEKGTTPSIAAIAINSVAHAHIVPTRFRYLWLFASCLGAAAAVHVSDVLWAAGNPTMQTVFGVSWLWLVLVGASLFPLLRFLVISVSAKYLRK